MEERKGGNELKETRKQVEGHGDAVPWQRIKYLIIMLFRCQLKRTLRISRNMHDIHVSNSDDDDQEKKERFKSQQDWRA